MKTKLNCFYEGGEEREVARMRLSSACLSSLLLLCKRGPLGDSSFPLRMSLCLSFTCRLPAACMYAGSDLKGLSQLLRGSHYLIKTELESVSSVAVQQSPSPTRAITYLPIRRPDPPSYPTFLPQNGRIPSVASNRDEQWVGERSHAS